MITNVNVVDHVVWFDAINKFVVRGANGQWDLAGAVSQKGLESILCLEHQLALEDVRAFINAKLYRTITGVERIYNAPDIARSPTTGRWVLNSWSPTAIEPSPGQWPRIERVLRFLTGTQNGEDPAGYEWLINWTAAKYQNPELLPTTAVLFATAPGAGKNYYFEAFRACLGADNTAHVQRSALENKFNAKWADKFFVFADECFDDKHSRDISQMLKVLITNPEIEVEAKYQNQKAIENKIAWVFASNDPTTPLRLERGDRRYTVYSRFDPVPQELTDLMRGSFTTTGAGQMGFTPEFRAEVAAFAEHLRTYQVDWSKVTRPYENEARATLIQDNDPSYLTFAAEVEEYGLDSLIAEYMNSVNSEIPGARKDWDWGEAGISSRALYALYAAHCKQTGQYQVKHAKFSSALARARPNWVRIKHYVPGSASGHVSGFYGLPRNPPKAQRPVTLVSSSATST